MNWNGIQANYWLDERKPNDLYDIFQIIDGHLISLFLESVSLLTHKLAAGQFSFIKIVETEGNSKPDSV